MKKILLIEDNKDVRETTSDILELADYEVRTAENGKQGVEACLDFAPDLIVCDIMMPELDGYGVLHILSKKTETAGIPFIFLTAKSEKAAWRRGMNLGADDYLTKPFEETELLDAIESRIKRNEIIKKEFANSIDGFNKFLDEATGYKELKDLSKGRKLKHYPKKSYVFMEGSGAHFAYFVQSGRIKIFKTNLDGKEFVEGISGPGDFIGYMALLSKNNQHEESAMILEDAEICAIPKDDFLQLLYSNKDVSARFIRMLSNDLIASERRIIRIAYDSVRQRVAETLLRLSDKASEVTLTREVLAGIIGIAKETTVRTLADFKREQLVDLDRRKIRILDHLKLQKLAD